MSATNHPFPKCEKGHDLTGEGAYIYENGGHRKCRMCAAEQGRKKREKTVHGAFDGGMPR